MVCRKREVQRKIVVNGGKLYYGILKSETRIINTLVKYYSTVCNLIVFASVLKIPDLIDKSPINPLQGRPPIRLLKSD